MGIAKTCTHLHPAHFSFDSALCIPLNIIRTKISNIQNIKYPKYEIWQFPQILAENFEVVRIPYMVSWGCWSGSGLRFLKFRPQNPFLGKFGPKNSKLCVAPENYHTWYLGGTDSEFGLTFLKFWYQNSFLGRFGQKNLKLFVLPESWHGILEELIPYPELDFRNSGTRIHFFSKFGPKKHSLFILIWDFTAFLGIQLVLDLYFKVALHASAAFYQWFWEYEVPIFLFYRGYIYIYIYIYTHISCVLVPVLSKFIFTAFCSIFMISELLGLLSIYYVLKKSQTIWPFFSFLGEKQIEKKTRQLINNYVHTKWMAHYVEVYMQSSSCFKVWLKQKLFDMKGFNYNYNLIYPTFFRCLLQFLP